MKLILMLSLLFFSLTLHAKEVLSVLVVYDTNSTSKLIPFNTNAKRLSQANEIVNKLNESFKVSLSNDIQFQLVSQKQLSFKTRANISDMSSLYRGNILNSAQNINLLTLNSIQRLYKADVVIAIIKSNEQIINGVLTCGMAVDIPTPNLPLALKHNVTPDLYMRHPDLGITFIEAEFMTCFKDNTLFAHEVGHGMGLTHHDDSITLRYLGAKGYVYKNDFGTIMIGGSFKGRVENVFSNPYIYDVHTRQAMGDVNSNSVEVLKANKRNYNLRGETVKLF